MTYYDKNGDPIGIIEWVRLFDEKDYQRVAHDHVDENTYVSTVWIGLDHRFGSDGPPLIFESMVFSNESDVDGIQRRYSTEEEALEGHTDLVLRLALGKERNEL